MKATIMLSLPSADVYEGVLLDSREKKGCTTDRWWKKRGTRATEDTGTQE